MTEEKQARVESLLTLLEQGDFVSTDGLLRVLTEVKVLGRVVKGVDPIFTSRGIKVLCSYAFTPDVETRREAQRCLANAMYLKPSIKPVFVEVGGYNSYIKLFKETSLKRNADDDFLLARIGFLLTAEMGDIVQTLLDDGILQDIQKVLETYVERSKKGEFKSGDELPLAEVLKFLYNVTFHVKVPEDTESPLVTPLIQLLLSKQFSKFQSPLTNIIHSLLNLPLSQSKPIIFPADMKTEVVESIITIIDNSIPKDTDSLSDSSLDENLSPVFALLCSIHEIAPEEVKDFMKLQLLPSETDRSLPLGQSPSLPSRLLRLTTNVFTQSLKDPLFTLLYSLCDTSPTTLVSAIGYGYASGFLVTHKIPIPPGLNNEGGRTDVNPVTGQRLDEADEAQRELREMTDEEKEREAERLFVLFERMRRLGVMEVENPIRTAQQSGRFEELD